MTKYRDEIAFGIMLMSVSGSSIIVVTAVAILLIYNPLNLLFLVAVASIGIFYLFYNELIREYVRGYVGSY